MRRFGRAYDRPLILGHRGAVALAVENTLSGVDAARRAGADGIEIDVQLSRDGMPVVFHDDTLARLTGRPDRVDSLTPADLRAVSIDGQAIPTLDDLLEATADLLVNIELKDETRCGNAALVAAVVDRIERHRAAARVLVSSFNPLAIARFRRATPAIPSALLVGASIRPRILYWIYPAAGRLLRPFAINAEAALITPRRVHSWRRQGYVLIAWTVNDPAEARRLWSLGVDGLICDDPRRIRSAIEAHDSREVLE